MDIDDQTRRIGQQKRVVIRQILHFQNDTRLSLLKLCYANLLKQTIVDIESLAHQCGSEFNGPLRRHLPNGVGYPLQLPGARRHAAREIHMV